MNGNTGENRVQRHAAYLVNETLGFHQIPKITMCINLNQHKIASNCKPSKPTNNFNMKACTYQSWVYSKCLSATLISLIQSPLPCICASKIWPSITEVWPELNVQRNTTNEDHWSQLYIIKNQFTITSCTRWLRIPDSKYKKLLVKIRVTSKRI
jgi:hypothetical protein